MNKPVMVVLAITLLVIALVAYSQTGYFASEKPREKITIAYIPVVQGLPWYIAVEKGYFEEEGLEAQMVRFDSPNQLIDSVVSGKVDIGATGASGIAAIAESVSPGTLKAFAFVCGTTGRLNDELLVGINSDIDSFADMEGKKLGHLPGIQFRTAANFMLKKNGVEPSSVELVDLPVQLQLQALASDQVDAVLTLEPTGTIGSIKNISKVGIASPMVKYIVDPWCGGAAVFSTKFMSERPDVVKKILLVFEKATKEYDFPDAKRYLAKYIGTDNATTEQLPLPLIKMYTDITEDDISAIQQWIDVFHSEGVIEDAIDVRKLILPRNESAWG